MNARLQQLSDHIMSKLPGLIVEAEGDINTALEICVSNANEAETEPVLTLGVSVKWNLDTNKIEVCLPVRVVHKYTSEGTLEDLRQPKLEAVDEAAKAQGRKFSRAVGKKMADVAKENEEAQ